MRAASVLRSLSLGLSLGILAGCGGGLDYYSGPPPETILRAPEISPDGSVILFAFQFRDHLPMLAAVPTDADKEEIVVFQTPPSLAWNDPSWSPDGNYFAAISYCEGAACYESATGYNIWRLEIGGPGMVRLNTIRDDMRRRDPVFGASNDEVYYVESSTKMDHVTTNDIARRSIIRLRRGHYREVFPDPIENLAFMNLGLNASVTTDRWLFVGMVYPGGDHPVVSETGKQGLKYQEALYRISGTSVTLERPYEVTEVAVSRSQPEYVYVRNVYPDNKLRYEFYLSEGGEDRLLFTYSSGHVLDLSVSEDLNHIVFRGQRQFNGPWAIWRYDVERGVLTDLQVPESLTKEVLRLMEEERGLRSAEAAVPLQ